MEDVPSEIIETNILLRITPEELHYYCATNRRYAKLCRQKSFWQLRVSRTPRRVLQDDWFLYFAHQGEISLLWPLINEMARQGVIIDNWAITYAAFYLLEQEEELSVDGVALLELLLADAGEDQVLRTLIRPFDLRFYFYAIREEVVTFRQQLTEPIPTDKGLPIYDHPAENWDEPDYVLYLGEFENRYLYDHVKDVLPPIRAYLEEMLTVKARAHKNKIADFTIPLVAIEAADGKMEEMKDLLSYVNEHAGGISVDYWIYSVTDRILEELPYPEAELLTPLGKQRVNSVSYLGLPFPIDPATYYYIISIRGYTPASLARAVRAIEPEVFIAYLDKLLTNNHISRSRMRKAMLLAHAKAVHIGYTYFASVLEDELETLE